MDDFAGYVIAFVILVYAFGFVIGLALYIVFIAILIAIPVLAAQATAFCIHKLLVNNLLEFNYRPYLLITDQGFQLKAESTLSDHTNRALPSGISILIGILTSFLIGSKIDGPQGSVPIVLTLSIALSSWAAVSATQHYVSKRETALTVKSEAKLKSLEAKVHRLYLISKKISQCSVNFAPPFNATLALESLFEDYQPSGGMNKLENDLDVLWTEGENILANLQDAINELDRAKRIGVSVKRKVEGTADLNALREVDILFTLLDEPLLLNLITKRQWSDFQSTLQDIASNFQNLLDQSGRSKSNQQTNSDAKTTQFDRALKTLGLPKKDITFIIARKHYRELVKEFHPDKFQKSPEHVRQKATEQFRTIHEAFGIVKNHLGVNQ